jgi:hypothetical protein
MRLRRYVAVQQQTPASAHDKADGFPENLPGVDGIPLRNLSSELTAETDIRRVLSAAAIAVVADDIERHAS